MISFISCSSFCFVFGELSREDGEVLWPACFFVGFFFGLLFFFCGRGLNAGTVGPSYRSLYCSSSSAVFASFRWLGSGWFRLCLALALASTLAAAAVAALSLPKLLLFSYFPLVAPPPLFPLFPALPKLSSFFLLPTSL